MQKFTPMEYLKIDLANSLGLDKKDWSERLQWFDSNQHRLPELVKQAENSAQYFAGLTALNDVSQGKPTGYLISLDATSSGIQILSVLTGDERAARISNVIDVGRRVDAYMELFLRMQSFVECPDLKRSDLKDPIMTAFYGSEKVPKDVFGDGPLLGAFHQTLETETPHIWALNKAFLKMWDPTVSLYDWVMPDGYNVRVKVKDVVSETVRFMGQEFTTERRVNRPTPKGRSIGANLTHSVDGFIVREMVRRCSFDPAVKIRVQQLINDGPQWMKIGDEEKSTMVHTLWEHYEKSGYLSARILDYLDETNIHLVNTDPLQDLLDSMPEQPFSLLAVHDCFKCHPNYGDDLRKQYNVQLSLIMRSEMLSFLLSQLLKREVTYTKRADFSEEILQANYALS